MDGSVGEACNRGEREFLCIQRQHQQKMHSLIVDLSHLPSMTLMSVPLPCPLVTSPTRLLEEARNLTFSANAGLLTFARLLSILLMLWARAQPVRRYSSADLA